MEGWEEQQITFHLNCWTHLQWEERKERNGSQKALLEDKRAQKAAEEKERLELKGTRQSCFSEEDLEFNMIAVDNFLSNGSPLNRLRATGYKISLIFRSSTRQILASSSPH